MATQEPDVESTRSSGSVAEFLGTEIRLLRTRAGWSLNELGRRVIVSGDLLGKVEKAHRRPQPDLLERLDAVFDTGGVLTRLGALIERQPAHGLLNARRP
jgi:transcriptional regulator with XRE-family HTH domain